MIWAEKGRGKEIYKDDSKLIEKEDAASKRKQKYFSFFSVFVIMFEKGRGRRLGKQMPGLPVQMFSQLSGERSDRGKPKVFRGSARNLQRGGEKR